MKLPGFLIIGAMKAGTTTLYEDLRGVPGLYLPPEKEPDDLAYAAIETPEGLAAYALKFKAAPAGALIGEASTSYAKRPTYDGVAARAKTLLGPDLKIIYFTRDPVKRIVSQYHHLWGLGLETRPLNEAVLNDPTYVDYSRYDWQLEPWHAAFPEAQIFVAKFEDYLADKATMLDAICAFLGTDGRVTQVDNTHRNASAGKLVTREGSIWRRVSSSRFYQYKVKPLLPTGLRDTLKGLVLSKAATMDETLTADTRAVLLERLGKTSP